MILRPLLGHLRKALTAVGTAKVAKEAPAVAKAAARTLRDFPGHLRNVKEGK